MFDHFVSKLISWFDCFFAGEYISLYHHQRALLQQREFQKNDYISRLAKDREDLQVCSFIYFDRLENLLFAG